MLTARPGGRLVDGRDRGLTQGPDVVVKAASGTARRPLQLGRPATAGAAVPVYADAALQPMM
jgi:hypothetical protein